MVRQAGLMAVLLVAGSLFGQDTNAATCPLHAQHMAEKKAAAPADGSAEHGAKVDGRHDTLGVHHLESVHSFRLFEDGGAIELRATDASDAAAIEAIRVHLREIVKQFAKADFTTPEFVHGRVPAGVEGMKRHHGATAYRFETLPSGGRIRITTNDAAALGAIHEFMQFQIVEHRTEDTGKVETAAAVERGNAR
ncbi:MAG TPA: hypothetical protein VNA69_10270 [Thermoanaerobaculia bacterium]|nr:hypothetical protein [Thermoanaerobaculia bacterium]